MFDGSLPEVGDLAALGDTALVDAVGGWARAENAACARKLSAMAELFCRRTGLDDAKERDGWWVDPDAAVAAESAAAVGISQGLALSQTHRGVALRDRLPTVAALFEAGLISDLLVRTIVWRTALILAPFTMKMVDRALAARVTRWGALSAKKTEQAIDALVEQVDPGALRRSREGSTGRDVAFGSPSDEPGFTRMWARLYASDAVVVERRVEEIARSVCDADPRSLAERRADALTALAAGHTALACECGESDCPAGQRDSTPPVTAIVQVIADEATVRAATATAKHAEPQQCTAPPAFVIGGGVMPAPLLAATLKHATVREVRHPGEAPPEPRYTPSRKLADFIRCRDLTCRFPGCDRPATHCDIDHTVPYPVGPTHPSNLKCLCRFHHLLKTFWNGIGGWRDRQLPDGTVIWTSPTGHTYTTYPGSRHLFPKLCKPTATLWSRDPPALDTTPDRGVMMPRRRHTRAHTTARAIAAERRLNDDLVAERNRPPPF
ncbi:MAG: DUF222 domain-containing protein [Mycobacterium sp.]